MANKYIDKSATFNGDGTASNQAASAGAVGAWNSLANCLNNVPGFGSIANGDNIFIRTKNGTDLSETKTDANITTPARTAALPVNWIFDDGTVWPGDSGVFTLTTAVTSTIRTWTLNNYNNLIGKNRNFKIDWSGYTGQVGYGLTTGINYITGIATETPTTTSNRVAQMNITGASSGSETLFDKCYFDINSMYGTTYEPMVFAQYGTARFVNCEIDLTGVVPSTAYGVLGLGSFGVVVEFIGGFVTGGDPSHSLVRVQNGSACTVIANGTDFGLISLDPAPAVPFSVTQNNQLIDLTNVAGTVFGMTVNKNSGRVDWRNGENYPYGNGVLIDASNTPWSYKVFSRASASMPLFFPVLEEHFTASAATKTITANLLINNNLTSPQKDEWWMTVSYVNNATGLRVSETTRASGALTTTTGVWNSTVYGAQNYTQYKVELTTANAIKQHTTILVTLFTTRPAVLSTDFYFVDPEVVIV